MLAASTIKPANVLFSRPADGEHATSVPTIRRVLAERGYQPAFYQDDVDFYDGPALLELRAFLNEEN